MMRPVYETYHPSEDKIQGLIPFILEKIIIIRRLDMSDSFLQEKSAQAANGKIFYYLENSFPGRPFVVFLHGLSSNHTTWLNIIKILHENKYNCLAPDMRGHGHSDKTKNKELYKLNIFSDDLREIIKNEQIKDFILVGYSFGGQVAIDYAARYPEYIKGLVLISANHAPPLKYLRLNFLTPLTSGILNLLAALLLWQKRQNYHYYQHGQAVGYWNSVWDGLRTMPISVNFWMLAQVAKINLENEIKQIKVPTILVYGRKDAFITQTEINDMAKAIPEAQLIISKNPSHFVGTNAQDETAQIILEFLSQL